jgi:hypothetical protein
MKSAGYTRKMQTEPSIVGADDGNTKIYPSMNIEHKSMPHLKNHKVGDTGEMHIKYKVTGVHQYKSGEGDTSMEITHYEPAKKVKGKTDEEQTDEANSDEKKQPTAKQE